MDPVRDLVNQRPWGDDVLRAASAPEASEVAPGIYMSPGTSNAYMVLTAGGRVIVNTGLGFEALVHKRNFDAVSTLPTTHILVTQGHVDHVGGVGLFREPGTRFIAQATTDPTYRQLVIDETGTSASMQQTIEGVTRLLPVLPAEVRAERSEMSRHLIVHLCAERERALQVGAATPRATWEEAAVGLVDALVGLWRAPYTAVKEPPNRRKTQKERT